MPVVSVIIPNYNHAPYLTQRIDSVLNQTFQDFEVIILDDCSTDNSRELIEKYRDHPKVIQIIYNRKNSGSTFRQWNKGLKFAKGEYIWIAESDDWAENTFLDTMVNEFLANSTLGLVFCNSFIVDKFSTITGLGSDSIKTTVEGIDWKEDQMLQSENTKIRMFLFSSYIYNASAVLFKKKVYDYSGAGNNVNFTLTGDLYTWLRILLFSDLKYIGKPLNYFRFHNTNVRSKVKEAGLVEYSFFKFILAMIESNEVSNDFKAEARIKLLYYWKICMLNFSNIGLVRGFKLTILMCFHYPQGIIKSIVGNKGRS